MFDRIKKHHVLFGLGALAAGYYFYKKRQEQQEGEEVREQPVEDDNDLERGAHEA